MILSHLAMLKKHVATISASIFSSSEPLFCAEVPLTSWKPRPIWRNSSKFFVVGVSNSLFLCCLDLIFETWYLFLILCCVTIIHCWSCIVCSPISSFLLSRFLWPCVLAITSFSHAAHSSLVFLLPRQKKISYSSTKYVGIRFVDGCFWSFVDCVYA